MALVNNYFATVRPTYLEQWPDALLRLSFATAFIPLSEHECEALISLCEAVQYGEGDPPQEILDAIAAKLDKKITAFPKGGFIRLGSRSPKDSWGGHNAGFRCTSGHQALRFLSESERVHEDLALARREGYQPHLVVREWCDIRRHEEFRVFVKDRRAKRGRVAMADRLLLEADP